jgi:hypothetical protein
VTRFMLAVALLGLVVGTQTGTQTVTQTQPPDESNLQESERRIPPGHYCKRADVPISKSETSAHPCSCTYSCSVDEEGNVTESESSACQAFCKKNGRRCTCHVEEPCPGTAKGNAVMDMDGTVVAVRVRPKGASGHASR